MDIEFKPGRAEMSDQDFLHLGQLVRNRLGIHWEEHKKEMVVGRLGKRIHHLGLANFADYCQLLTNHPDDPEWQELYNVVTTNKTAFFREPGQFDFLEREWFQELRQQALLGRLRKLRLWSAACSSGAEPYSLAISVSEGLGVAGPWRWDIRILASDINTRVLALADKGCFSAEEVTHLPRHLREKYFNSQANTVNSLGSAAYCVRDNLRHLIQFRPINLMAARYPINTSLDLILCRNVLIYFDQKTAKAVIQRLVAMLQPNGYLLLGHAESIQDLPGLIRLPHNIYRKKAA